MQKLIPAILLVSVIIGLFLNKAGSQEADPGDSVFKVAVYPSGSHDGTYLFVLWPGGLFEVMLGERRSRLTDSGYLMKSVDQKDTKILTKQDYDRAADLINRIDAISDRITYHIVMDGWDVAIYSNGQVIETNYTGNEIKEISSLIDLFIQLSPILVELHGWA